MINSLATSISIADAMIQYNSYVKNVLAYKEILAWILKHTVVEFKYMNISEIVECIEGDPKVSTVKVNPGETNAKSVQMTKIDGSATENNIPEEGIILYDIKFYAYVPSKVEAIKIIVNVEAQKDFYPGYQIVTRGIFYSSRMISAQLGTEFEIPHYDDIKKVYSIWICMNAPKKTGNAISEYSLEKHDMVPGISDKRWAYDKISIIVICLNEGTECEVELLSMLNILFSTKLNGDEKRKKLEEYHINMTDEQEEEVNIMCNIAEYVFEKAWKEGTEAGMKAGMEAGMEAGMKKLISKKLAKGLSIEVIAEHMEESVDVIRKIISEI